MKKLNILHTSSTAILSVIAFVMMTRSAMATPGHNHSANEAMLMHVLFYGSIVAVVAAAVWFVYRQLNNQSSK